MKIDVIIVEPEELYVDVWTAPTEEMNAGYTDDEFGSDAQAERMISDHE